jgi:serine phosphatase RsbU (regulator of sigma subunit)
MGGGLETILVVGPVVASAELNPKRTAAIVGLALVAGAAAAGVTGRLGVAQDTLRLVALLSIGVFCVVVAGRRQGREERLGRLARVAEVTQAAILRPVPPRAGHVDFATRYLSAAEDATMGGDLFDVVVVETKVRLIVGDVRGKGLDAIRLAAMVLGLFREAAAIEGDLAAVAKSVDTAVAGYLGEEDFVTAVFVEFDAGGAVSVLNCGHHPPLRLGSSAIETLNGSAPSPPLGLSPTFTVDTYTIERGDRILVYTDGLIEARDSRGSFFDLDHLPEGFLTTAAIEETLDALVERLLAHVDGHMSDDMAIVLAQPFWPDSKAHGDS